jgi:hypothetical protein
VADTLYTDATVLLLFDFWDTRVQKEKPSYRPHDAWFSSGDVSTIELTIRKPGTAVDEVKTLAGGGIAPSGKLGQWKAHFHIDGGAGTYTPIFKATTNEGYRGVQVTKIRAKAWPA